MSITTMVPARRAARAALHSPAACGTAGVSPESSSTCACHPVGTSTASTCSASRATTRPAAPADCTRKRLARCGPSATPPTSTPAAATLAQSARPSVSSATAAARPTRSPRCARAIAAFTAAPPARSGGDAADAPGRGTVRSQSASPTQTTSKLDGRRAPLALNDSPPGVNDMAPCKPSTPGIPRSRAAGS